jgi:5-methylcytosine-specific restriction enzyme A
MLKSCSYCSGIHDHKVDCGKKPKRTRDKLTDADRFRWLSVWQRKRKYIREDRDLHMCQICVRELYDTQLKYNYEDISVHHIIPIEESNEGWDKRLDDEWLISLCRYHHELAEKGTISRKELRDIVKEQQDKRE